MIRNKVSGFGARVRRRARRHQQLRRMALLLSALLLAATFVLVATRHAHAPPAAFGPAVKAPATPVPRPVDEHQLAD